MAVFLWVNPAVAKTWLFVIWACLMELIRLASEINFSLFNDFHSYGVVVSSLNSQANISKLRGRKKFIHVIPKFLRGLADDQASHCGRFRVHV